MKKLPLLFLSILLVAVSAVAQPVLLWHKLDMSQNPATSDLMPCKLQVDPAGNIVLAFAGEDPYSLRSGYFIQKYDPQGNLLWEQEYLPEYEYENGELFMDMDVDWKGRVVLTGNVLHENYWRADDILLAQCNADGGKTWEHIIRNPAFDRTSETPRELVVDDLGQIYLTGLSETPYLQEAVNENMVIYCYSPKGSILWGDTTDLPYSNQPYNEGGIAIALDSSRTPVVTGTLAQTPDTNYMVFTKSMIGETWSDIWGDPVTATAGKDITIDRNNDVIVLAADGNVSITDWYYPDGPIILLKYSMFGNLQWEQKKLFSKEEYPEQNGIAIATDRNNNVIVTGWIQKENQWRAITTLKFAPDGTELWRRIYTRGDEEGYSDPVGLMVDTLNNIYILATTTVFETKSDVSLLKYDPDGNLLWEEHFNTDTTTSESARDFGMDKNGNVYIVANVRPFNDWYNSYLLLLKYSVATGVEENTANNIKMKVWPNPAGDKFEVMRMDTGNGAATLQLMYLNGKKLLEKQIPPGNRQTTVNVSHLQSGLYLCRMTIGNRNVTKKLMIQR